ncbi:MULTISPECIES: type I polyketide synthase [Halomonadaceae]|uniref:Acyltransferase domain-containing protein n=2 Tax=Halomonadaceae TaxID=28256 RepID=A0ABR9F4K2_9GAMM|nr:MULTISPECIES: type I polyketide synthase [Halomonas]MBE0401370.1 acyltransferase domain-containing protein [Halomonas casei]WKD30467.1 acyltransferase domain-containing protein [Halomonas sp. KG2]
MHSNDIAIIGLSGRFPGGLDVRGLWNRLRNSESCIKGIAPDALRGTTHEKHLDDPNYIFRCAVLPQPELFDADYFRMNHAEAMITDPQQRVFLEVCHEVLNHCGLPDPESQDIRTGVFAGTSVSIYLLHNIMGSTQFANRDIMQILMGTDKDFIATRVAYKLNLRGISMTIQSGCSTSLVAVHQACQALLNGELDLALAGGATITGLGEVGYLYTPGGVRSSDGRCRPYDADADGTIFGDGVGAVALCRLEDALANGSKIYAVIKGSAVNNNGADCAGFAAPSVSGQAQVIRDALHNADVRAEDVAFVEGHGTATALGDPIEVQALTLAYGTSQRQYCALGSVKSNVGHLDVASGVTGLIKATLALHDCWLPGTLNFTQPNPALELERTPFFICNTGAALPRHRPLHAGVSSFGFGGTNAHVVLATPPRRTSRPSRQDALLYLWSARSNTALDRYIETTQQKVAQDPSIDRGDVAYTLAHGRTRLKCRAALAGNDLLSPQAGTNLVRGQCSDKPVRLVMLFPGQGSPWSNVAKDLYHRHQGFRDEVDRLSAEFSPFLGTDLRRWLFPQEGDRVQADEYAQMTRWSQPALFVLCLGLRRVFQEAGLHEQVVAGHSLGELIGAYAANALPKAEAARVLDARARLMEATGSGAMLALSLPRERVEVLLHEEAIHADLAAVNGPMQTVISGSKSGIDAAMSYCKTHMIRCRKLPVSRGFHSYLMQKTLPEWRETLDFEPGPLTVALASNVNGRVLPVGHVLDADYWVQHLRGTVDFAGGITDIMHQAQQQGEEPVFLEVGPGNAMGTLVRMHYPSACVISCTDQNDQITHDSVMKAIGAAWVKGVTFDLNSVIPKGNVVDLPVPALDRHAFWITPDEDSQNRPENSAAAPDPARSRPPQTESGIDVKETMLQTWKKIILNQDITVDDNFFALGGDSLQALEISRELANSGISIKPTDILKTPVMKDLLVQLMREAKQRCVSETPVECSTVQPAQMSDDEMQSMLRQLGMHVDVN